MEDYKYLLRVNCITYNHADYITKAMDGFCMQETSFPFVCVIVDDASTDGEQDVIRHYLETNFETVNQTVVSEETNDYILIFARHKINRNCFFAAFLLKYNHYRAKKTKRLYFDETYYTKYVALCEGDDYWIHPQKLQKQIDFLEKHPNNSGCIHAYRRDDYQNEGISSIEIHKYQQTTDAIPTDEVICGKRQFCATASWVYRSSAVENYPDWASRAPVGDKPLKLVLFARGPIGYLDEVMSVYRVGVPGSWTIRVFRNREAEKKSRKGQMQIIKDFDKWTNGKYHNYIKRNLAYCKYVYWKTDYLIRPYLWLRKRLRV